MTYKLMIKIHNKTGMKYLCMTVRDKYEKYTGSGVYWKKHLGKHGVDISTELLYESDNKSDFVDECLKYSILYQVDVSEEWANLVPEIGDSNDNFKLFWEYATESIKAEIYVRRKNSLQQTWALKSQTDRKEISNKISSAQKQFWAGLSETDRKERMERVWVGVDRFLYEKGKKSECEAEMLFESRDDCRKPVVIFKHDKLKCPYCGFIGGGGSMKRWHFENCKEKK